MIELSRFIEAQANNTYVRALSEIRAGKKRSHWMWCVFPQIVGLGSSPMAQRYAIANRKEAEAYFADAELGQNLQEISEALLALDASDPRAVMGWPDDLKLKSSMTLFTECSDASVFPQVLAKYFDDARCDKTLKQLNSA